MKFLEILQILFYGITILSILIGGISWVVRFLTNLKIDIELVKEKVKELPEIKEKIDGLYKIFFEFQYPFAFKVIKMYEKENPLTKEEKELRDKLLEKLQNKIITKEELFQLKKILEKEKEEAEKKGDAILLWAIGIILGIIFLYSIFKKED